MPEAWLIRKTDDYDRFKYSVGDWSAGMIPRVGCPSCGEVRTWGLSYPSVDLQVLGEDVLRWLKRGRDSRIESLSLEQYRELEQTLAPLLGPNRPLRPLTNLGPSTGLAEGAFPDFTWAGGLVGDIFMRRSVFETVCAAGFALTGIKANLQYRRERKDPLIQLEILPGLHVHEAQRPELCATCGFANERPKGIRISPDDFDDTIPLQRIYERPDFIVANAAFSAFVRERELTAVRLAPVIFE
ncbi:MAG: hypothetical protein IMF08_12680 [Proteobacteria bacterium]|nr:hypothetical protein [Pseudomonadota bacterium]